MERKRSKYYVDARWWLDRAFEQSSHFYSMKSFDVSPILSDFSLWSSSYKIGKYVRLKRRNEFLFVRAINRFMPEYRKLLWKKLDYLNDIPWDLMLSFTLDPKLFTGKSLSFEIAFLLSSWNKILTVFRKKFRGVRGDGIGPLVGVPYGHTASAAPMPSPHPLKFFRVIEFQKSGRPHLHILLSGVSWVDWHWLFALWQKYGAGGCYISRVWKQFSAVKYVIKYLNKSLGDETYGALLFASNRRMFSNTRRSVLRQLPRTLDSPLLVTSPMSNSNLDKFAFDGSVLTATLTEYCELTNRQISDFVWITLTDDVPDLWLKELFNG